jgi:V/A-type H+-transporting ATPase subunit A
MGLSALDSGVSLEDILNLPVREAISRMKYIPEQEKMRFIEIEDRIKEEFSKLTGARV